MYVCNDEEDTVFLQNVSSETVFCGKPSVWTCMFHKYKSCVAVRNKVDSSCCEATIQYQHILYTAYKILHKLYTGSDSWQWHVSVFCIIIDRVTRLSAPPVLRDHFSIFKIPPILYPSDDGVRRLLLVLANVWLNEKGWISFRSCRHLLLLSNFPAWQICRSTYQAKNKKKKDRSPFTRNRHDIETRRKRQSYQLNPSKEG